MSMKKLKKSDPFTGVELDAIEMTNGDLVLDTPFYKNLSTRLTYNTEKDVYEIPKNAFNYVELITLRQAAELLGVYKMYVSRLCKNRKLDFIKVNDKMLISKQSVLNYKEQFLC